MAVGLNVFIATDSLIFHSLVVLKKKLFLPSLFTAYPKQLGMNSDLTIVKIYG